VDIDNDGGSGDSPFDSRRFWRTPHDQQANAEQKMGSAANIRNRQIEWGEKEGIPYDKDKRYSRLEDNLCLQKIHPKTRYEFEQGDGGELKRRGGREPNMHSLFSSAALACNFFDYWRDKDAGPLAVALGVDEVRDMRFEQRFATDVDKSFPNLDVVLSCGNETIIAVECKFSEPYKGAGKNSIVDAYFPEGEKLWEQHFYRCQDAAENLRYRYLDAAQLLKHMLGLANSRGTGKPMPYKKWTLLYLWFNPGGLEADRHEGETKRFIGEVSRDGKVGGGGKIVEMTYQNLFGRLPKRLNDSHEEYEKYRAYLCERYFRES